MGEGKVPKGRPGEPVPEPTFGPSAPSAEPRSVMASPRGLAPHLPSDVVFSPLGSSFYAESFRMRAWMRDAPARLVSEGRLPGRSFGPRPMTPWSTPLAPAPPHEPTVASNLAPERSREQRTGPDMPLEGVEGVPSIRPEPSARWRAALPQVPEADRSAPTP